MSVTNCKYWKTKSGELIAYTEMENSHVLNSIRYLLKRQKTIPSGLLEEAHKRGLSLPEVLKGQISAQYEIKKLEKKIMDLEAKLEEVLKWNRVL